MPRGHQCHGLSKLGHSRGVASAAPGEAAVGQAFLPGGLVVVIMYFTNSQQNIAFLNTLGQVLREIDMPFIVDVDLYLAGDVLEQSKKASFTQYTPVLLHRPMTRRRAWTRHANSTSSVSSWYRCQKCGS